MGDHHHHEGDGHHHEEGHHGGHHAPKLSELQRRLYKRPPGVVNSCTDFNIAYDSCVREHSGNPLSFMFGVFWADRWLCAHEKHDFNHCEGERAQVAFRRNIDILRANRQGEIS